MRCGEVLVLADGVRLRTDGAVRDGLCHSRAVEPVNAADMKARRLREQAELIRQQLGVVVHALVDDRTAARRAAQAVADTLETIERGQDGVVPPASRLL